MADLTTDTELTEIGPARFERTLCTDWEIWGPNGGYVAAIALRAAQRHCGRARPANASVHFLGVANFDSPITVTTHTRRSTRNADSVGVRIEQSGKPILAAMVGALDNDLQGLAHAHAPMPDVPTWTDCPTNAERWAESGLEQPNHYRFRDNFEQRSPVWISDWENRTPGAPLYREWLRFVAGGATTDAWMQACRLLLLVDLGGWPAIGRRHVDNPWMAPSIDVSCEFHQPCTGDEWFLLQGESPHAGDGLVASHQHVWNPDGDLLASGVSHMLCRKIG